MEILYGLFDTLYQSLLLHAGFTAVKVRSSDSLIFLFIVPIVFSWGLWTIVRQRRSAHMLGMRSPVLGRLIVLFLTSAALSAYIIALAEPYSIIVKDRPVYKGEAVQFIIDITPSQRAEDVSPNRLEATKTEVALAVDRMSERGISYFCLSYFTRTYNVLLECTDDVNNMKETLRRLDTAFSNETGTNLLAAFREDYTFVRQGIPADTRITAVVITDGGKEACRKSGIGEIEYVEPDWKEDELQRRVVELATKDHIRIIPVGVGGPEYAPSPVFDTFGRKSYVMCDEQGGGTLMARLERETIKKIAVWAGDPNRYFILDRSNQEKHELASWLDSYMTANLVVDHTIPEDTFSDIWRWPLGVFIICALLALGVLGFMARIFDRIFRR